MSDFENATVERLANIYFNGGVTSRNLVLPTGEKKTLGIMQVGEYRFDTAAKELMEIQAGEVEVLLPGAAQWKTIAGGESFEVPGNSAFDIKVKTITDYCCSYLD
ncbi:MAG: hypothetical protein ACI95C_003046 [Pseudohongiellaceae bacterium]|jgi:uncharacterized protein YaiE (UPF0345 family)